MLRRLKHKLDEMEFGKVSNIIKRIEKYEYVSFDIFDTLIKRDVYKPVDVFRLMEKSTQINGFAQARIQAEQKARITSGKIDITLEDIYGCFNCEVNVDEMIELERKYECNLCTSNSMIIPIYQWCVENQKKIIILSDMYLDQRTIEIILKNNGFVTFDRLFISNQEQKTKQCGNFYPYVLDVLKIDKSKIVHIGNSFVADYYRAIKNGWNAIKVKTSYSNMLSDYNHLVKETSKMELKYLESFINNHTDDNNRHYQFGYENFGPALVGFTKWLLDAMIKQKREVALFLGRDGYIMKQVYEMLGYHKIIPAEYIEVSRRCFRIIDFVEPKTFEDVFPMLPLRGISSIAEYIECLGLELSECQPILRELGLDENKAYWCWQFGKEKELKKLYGRLQDKVVCNARAEKESLLAYIKTFTFNRRIGLVDVGWGGTIQHYLEMLLTEQQDNVDMLGYYWGVANRAKQLLDVEKKAKAQGYFYDCLTRGDKHDYQRPFDGLIETLFLQQVGSVKKYEMTTDGINIIRERYEYVDNPEVAYIVKSIQEGALAFVEEYKDSVLFDNVDFDKDIMFANLYHVCTNPSKDERDLFKNIYFYDSGNMKKLFEDYSFFYAITHPRKFKDGYYESYWRIGYLKNIFKIKLPYMYICLEVLPGLRDFKGKIRGIFKLDSRKAEV